MQFHGDDGLQMISSLRQEATSKESHDSGMIFYKNH